MSQSYELPTLTFSFDNEDEVSFSYTRPEHGIFKRIFIRTIERCTGQLRLERLYLGWATGRRSSENIFTAGIRLLNIRLDYDSLKLAAVPTKGPVLFISNHPFGVVDGLAMGHLATKIRPDTLIMTHSLLCQPPEARQFLLPVDFGGTEQALATTVATRRRAVEWLQAGHSIVVFPGGGVATSQKPVTGPAIENPWHPFVGKLARLPGVTVVPVYFHGQNSRLFQIASHVNYALRVALLFRESVRRIGGKVQVSIGNPISEETINSFADRASTIQNLKAITLQLGGKEAPSPDLEFKFPKYVYSD
jgi:putative hemolysin